jgi:hypothetical protein
MRTLLLAVLLTAAALLVACGGSGNRTAEVAVTLDEWAIGATPAEVRPGTVRFDVTNSGSRVHQLVLVKSDLPPGQLPTTDVAVDLTKVNVSSSIEAIQPGATATAEVELFPGKYVLICNLVDRPPSGPADPHYLNGMAASFLVLDH